MQHFSTTDGQKVFLIARRSLQNRLFLSWLEKNCRRRCVLVKHLPDSNDLPRDASFFLVDADSRPQAELEALVAMLHRKRTATCRVEVIVFNARQTAHGTQQEGPVTWVGLEVDHRSFLTAIHALSPRAGQGAQRRKEPTGSAAQPLTRREREVLMALAQFGSNCQIADHLHLSLHTVKTHLYNAYRKIGVQNRVEAVRWANEHLTAG